MNASQPFLEGVLVFMATGASITYVFTHMYILLNLVTFPTAVGIASNVVTHELLKMCVEI
jgi:hypothetical protein